LRMRGSFLLDLMSISTTASIKAPLPPHKLNYTLDLPQLGGG
jgi:hypothetical protein